MHFDLLQSLSLAGDSTVPNDDRAGMSPCHAWVIDGATDLGPPGLVGSLGGAAWLAGHAHAAFMDASRGSIEAIFAEVGRRMVEEYGHARTRLPHGRWELPIAAALAVRLTKGLIEAAWLGDCVALLKRGGAVTRIGPPHAARAEESERAASLSRHGLGSVKRGPLPILDDLRASRSRPGIRVLGVERETMADLSTARVICSPGDELLLMTDGFSALVDSYAAYSESALMAAISAEGLAPLATRLRTIEQADSLCTRYPRFKISDDATALWLRVGA